jgi:hypothetical protein
MNQSITVRKSKINMIPHGKYHTKMVTKIEGKAEQGQNRATLRKERFAKVESKAKKAADKQAFITKEARQAREVKKYLAGKRNWAKKAE